MSKFRIDAILIAKEDANGAIPANPVLLKICPEEYTIKEVYDTEEIACLLIDGKKTIEGESKIEGGMKYRLDAQLMPMIAVHTFGTPDSTADFTAVSWTASTVIDQGTVVNHSDGEHSLYAIQVYGDKTTGAIEPTETGRDNNVKWVLVNKLQTQEYSYKDSCPTFTTEYKLTDGTDIFYQRFTGAELGQLPLNVEGESSTYETDFDFSASIATNNQQPEWDTNLEAIAGAKIVSIEGDYYGGSCSATKVKINDIDVEDTESVSMTLDKKIEQKSYLNCQKSNIRDLEVKGELKEDFTIERFNAASENERFKIDLNISTKVGAYAYFTWDSVYRSRVSADLAKRDDVTLSPEITAEQVGTDPIMRAIIVSPILIADDGTVIGSY